MNEEKFEIMKMDLTEGVLFKYNFVKLSWTKSGSRSGLGQFSGYNIKLKSSFCFKGL
jgi:hypothetical protein